MADEPKKRLRVCLEYLCDLEGTFDEAIEAMKEQQKRLSLRAADLQIEDRSSCDECDGVSLRVTGIRDETDAEQRLRLDRERAVEQAEFADYERLKAKFEGTGR